MRPVLVHAGPFAIHSWGVMAAMAFLAAGWILRMELQRRSGRGAAAYALTIAAAVGGIVGARVYWLVEHAGSARLSDSLSGAGFTWYGGVIGAAVAMLAVARRKRLNVTALLACSAPALALGYAIGRIGCQLAGDGTYGTRSDLPWAMSYPHGEVPTTDRVHPTPVYETLSSLLIFALLWRLRTRVVPMKLFGCYLLLAGAERFAIELIRRNEHVLLGLTQPQLFAAAMTIVGVALLAWPRRSALTSPATA